ncbi:MAG: cysteine desulfurase [Rhodobacteraceae bacterium]|nr:MAG: cysteine desulfurase [Paracoccaceae bacterium]
MESAILGEWLAFGLRWLHVITAIAWIGSSFYFIALDLALRKAPDMGPGVHGEEWQVHGGGFYHIQKYLVAPDRLPEHLTWFKWESYATWMSGFALLAVVYYGGAELYLVDPAVRDLSPAAAIAISLVSLGLGWVAYDRLCRSRWGEDQNRLMLILFGVLLAAAWFYAQVFSGRAALLHLGAFTGTIMAANVFLTIIPNQKIVVADLIAGRAPDPEFGRIAKQRSLHNNYLTLPVLFLMLSSHNPLAFASRWNWLIAALTFLMGVTIRHFFNTMHAGKGRLWWPWAATAAIFLVIVGLSQAGGAAAEDRAASGPAARRFAEAPGFEDVAATVLGRCSMCHAAEPLWPGVAAAPGGVRLDSDAEIARHARLIYLHAGLTRAMPPGNLTGLEPEERAAIVAWYRAAR